MDLSPEEVVALSAGASMRADCPMLSSEDFHLDEATLTGETYPIEKDRALFQPTPRSPRARILCSWVPILSLEERSAP
jgi:Mg2+-importing ATPase